MAFILRQCRDDQGQPSYVISNTSRTVRRCDNQWCWRQLVCCCHIACLSDEQALFLWWGAEAP